ncbi:MAG: CvpA family protein [Anaerolineae bacterium]|nr:CvpA family protein [Anaerolineae bacterium]
MGPMDMFLLLIAVGCIVLSLYQRFIRSLIMVVGAYIGTLISALIYKDAAFRLKAIGHGAAWFEGTVFLVLFFLVFLVFYFASRAAYPDTSLPKLGFLDHLLGGALGVIAAAILMIVVYNGLGVMVSDFWEPYPAYVSMVNMRGGIKLGGLIRQLTQIYALAFYPFFYGIGFPRVLQPL